ncbi:MAG: hypothetical protein ACE5E5_10495 [Phycisphaerae bacterium]
MPTKRVIQRAAGLSVWLAAAALLTGSIYTVRANIARPAETLRLRLPRPSTLAVGDGVFLSTDAGLQYAGEVRRIPRDSDTAWLALHPASFAALNEGTVAVCWQTPLTAEEMIPALLPPAVRRKMGAQISADWAKNEAILAKDWSPLLSELVAAYFDAIGDDVESALQRHEPQLWDIATHHGHALSQAWPRMQARLGPILEEHLTPVLGRLMNDAITEAPKVAIAWNVARGRNDEAFKTMLDWLGRYLATMSEPDKQRLEQAFHKTWLAARADKKLGDEIAALGRGLIEDGKLRRIISAIYREAISDNPNTTTFIRTNILDSPLVRRQLYDLVETLAPTVKRILAIGLFDSTGRTRPEVVQFVRSTALNRRVAWVTLHPKNALDAPPLAPGATLPVTLKGTHP